ncbi:sugar kinase [Pullulanibacillus sp. KACC 23026]|uniref:sugar kinase n=1 Tax=Pullulanibacillus sp. KACC 23026 TaxID=3028315 RepID=UPI0023AFF675|nr:sugar kinase [Pullulanibacillus sp. KACC 23026]WEG10786.1 sugar kinase [Pullulanibacillus sp. KACC 23026]
MKPLEVVTFGEAMAMFIANEVGELRDVDHYTRGLAGAEVNVAIGLARLGFKSGWVSKVGKDPFGEYIIKKLIEEKVNIDQVLIDNTYPTGFQIKSKVLSGDPSVHYFRKGSAASHLNVTDFDSSYFESAKLLHLTGIPLAISNETREFSRHAFTFMKDLGRSVSFDPNLRPNLWKTEAEMIAVTNEFAAQADLFLPGLNEAKILTSYDNPRDIALFYLDKGVNCVVVKLGEQGAFYKTKAEEGVVPPLPVETVIDTVGAGDGFAVGVISGLLEDLPLREAVIRGNAIGAIAVQASGDHEGYPNKVQLNEFIQLKLKGVH